MPSDDRDKLFERALARHLPGASPDAACPDAEILAAYHERSLSLDEMAHWKLHIAACSRCQETLALLEQTDSVVAHEWEKGEVAVALQSSASLNLHEELFDETPAPPESVSAAPIPTSPVSEAKASLQRRAPWRLFVPVGALAAGLLVWVALHEKARVAEEKNASVQVAENRQPAAPVSQSARDENDANELKTKEEFARADLENSAKTATRTVPKLKKNAPSERKQQPIGTASESVEVSRDEKGTTGTFATTQSAPMSAPETRANSPARREMAPTPPSSSAAQAQASGVAGGVVAGSRSDSQENKAQNEALNQKTSGRASVAQQYQLNSSLLKVLDKDARRDPSVILTPDLLHAWRVLPGGKIEFTADGGYHWLKQKSGVTADLTTGSAPSSRECWIVGKSGTLLLTTDGGKHWKQITSPVSGDLGGVHAVDAQRASIWDVANRRSYETADGGATWKQTANE